MYFSTWLSRSVGSKLVCYNNTRYISGLHNMVPHTRCWVPEKSHIHARKDTCERWLREREKLYLRLGEVNDNLHISCFLLMQLFFTSVSECTSPFWSIVQGCRNFSSIRGEPPSEAALSLCGSIFEGTINGLNDFFKRRLPTLGARAPGTSGNILGTLKELDQFASDVSTRHSLITFGM